MIAQRLDDFLFIVGKADLHGAKIGRDDRSQVADVGFLMSDIRFFTLTFIIQNSTFIIDPLPFTVI